MKKFVLAAFVFGLSNTAFAISTVTSVARCQPEKRIPDLVKEVEVVRYVGPSTIGKKPVFTATLKTFMFPGNHRFVTTFSDLDEVKPRGMGGALSYESDDFQLTIETDTPAVGLNMFHSTLNYQVKNGARQSMDLICDVREQLPEVEL